MTSTFAYQATSVQGLPISGSIQAENLEHARSQLSTLQLSVLDLQPQAEAPPSSHRMGAMDFIAFNQQLAHLTGSGMPVEQGLKLIAEDLHVGKLKRVIAEISRDLDAGTPLATSLSNHARSFPPLYAKLVEAGIESSNLPAMLLNIGRHADMVARLRQQLWRALAYPVAMFVAATALVTFVGWFVMPRLVMVLADFRTDLPFATKFFVAAGDYVPPIMMALAAIFLLSVLLAPVLSHTAFGRWVTDTIFMRLPLIGPALRFNLLARWCDALRVAIDGSIDLPRAISLTGSLIASPRVVADSQKLESAASGGMAMQSAGPLSILPATIPATIDFASRSGQLPGALATLAHLYQQQAEMRIAAIPTVLTPLVIIPVAVMIAFAILAMMLPMISLIQSVSSPGKK
jgi:type II secretory pathway component PulF